MWQEIAGSIHDVNSPLPIGHSDMNVESENQQRASHGLQLLHQQLVSFIVKYLLILPARNRMGGRRSYRQTILVCKARDDASQPGNISACLLDISTDTRSDLHH